MQHSILILDDDVHVRESLAIALEDEGFIVFEADSAEAAFEFLEVRRVDMVIVDLRLPGMNGTDFINAAAVRWPDMKFVIYTGSPEFKIPLGLSRKTNVSNSVFIKPLPSSDPLVDEMRRMLA
ncbi:response regulator [Maridesulfovibrio sp. FT414]|uniref:response regulator n=1 Tax=Maridesulfovibrio sp. FT414 TaxID=2979469 RepID=UPI003D805BC3